jgi:hypothetical protein
MHTMRSGTVAMVAVLASALTAGAAESVPDKTPRIHLAPGSRLTLRGKSTLHDYASTATQLQLAVELAEPEAAPELARLAAPGAVKSIVLTVPVQGMKSDKDGLDKNMYKALKAEQHPAITFEVRRYEIGAMKDRRLPVRVAGVLSVAGVEREAELTLETRATDEGLSVTGEKELLMTDFGIKPPKFMLGTLKTDDKVVIRFSLVLALTKPVLAEAR